MKTLIKDGLVLLKDGDGYKIEKNDILLNGRFIEAISPTFNPRFMYEANEVVDAFGKLVMPGLINAHTHAYMSLFRNYADDMEFFDWLNKVQAVEEHMTEEDCYWGTLLSAIEMIRSGTTCFVDMNIKSAKNGATEGPASACAGAASDAGIRAVISRGLAGVADSEESIQKFGETTAEMDAFKDNELISFMFGPHAPYSCMADYLQKLTAAAKERGIGQTIHLSESETEMANMAHEHGCTPIKYVADLGVFDVPVIAAHCVNATDDDIRIMKEKNVSIAINPKSNMKLGNGFAPVEKFLQAGINVCIGTDGCGSNNSQNMFQEMNTAALVYKGANKKARCFDADEIIYAATEGGAKAIGMEGQLGVIKEGALADIIILDLYEPQFFPTNNLLSSLVYSAKGSEVDTVFINGRMVMDERHILTINASRVFSECEQIATRLGMLKRLPEPQAGAISWK